MFQLRIYVDKLSSLEAHWLSSYPVISFYDIPLGPASHVAVVRRNFFCNLRCQIHLPSLEQQQQQGPGERSSLNWSPSFCNSFSSLERIWVWVSLTLHSWWTIGREAASIVTLWGRAVKHYSFTEQLQANVAWVDKYALQSSPTSSTTPLTGHTNHSSPSQYIKNF